MKTRTVNFLVDPEVEKKIREAAWTQKKGVSAFVRDLVEEYLQQHQFLKIDEAKSRQFSELSGEQNNG